MSAKGTSDTCCCGGCSETPFDTSLTPGLQFQPLQQFCCACIPNYLCALYTCPNGKGSKALLTRINQCDPVHQKTVPIYTGTVTEAGVGADITLGFDVVGTNCYLYLTSYAFGVTDSRIQITDQNRSAICPRVDTCDESVYFAEPFQWLLPNGCTLQVFPASVTSLAPIARDKNCPDPCSEPYAAPYPADRGCFGGCSGCGCICTCACIRVIHSVKGLIADEQACLCGDSYVISTGLTITVEQNYSTNCCQLAITNTGNITATATPAPIAIGVTSTQPCPFPQAHFQFIDKSDGEPVDVFFQCSACLGCDVAVASKCCPNEAATIPTLLHVHINGGPYCCSADMVIEWQFPGAFWTGMLIGGWCNNPINAHDVSITMICTGSTFQITFSAGVCTQEIVTGSGTCEPFDQVFQVPMHGIGCCGGVGDPGGLLITVEITA